MDVSSSRSNVKARTFVLSGPTAVASASADDGASWIETQRTNHGSANAAGGAEHGRAIVIGERWKDHIGCSLHTDTLPIRDGSSDAGRRCVSCRVHARFPRRRKQLMDRPAEEPEFALAHATMEHENSRIRRRRSLPKPRLPARRSKRATRASSHWQTTFSRRIATAARSQCLRRSLRRRDRRSP
jgi:hypothetical protein